MSFERDVREILVSVPFVSLLLVSSHDFITLKQAPVSTPNIDRAASALTDSPKELSKDVQVVVASFVDQIVERSRASGVALDANASLAVGTSLSNLVEAAVDDLGGLDVEVANGGNGGGTTPAAGAGTNLTTYATDALKNISKTLRSLSCSQLTFALPGEEAITLETRALSMTSSREDVTATGARPSQAAGGSQFDLPLNTLSNIPQDQLNTTVDTQLVSWAVDPHGYAGDGALSSSQRGSRVFTIKISPGDSSQCGELKVNNTAGPMTISLASANASYYRELKRKEASSSTNTLSRVVSCVVSFCGGGGGGERERESTSRRDTTSNPTHSLTHSFPFPPKRNTQTTYHLGCPNTASRPNHTCTGVTDYTATLRCPSRVLEAQCVWWDDSVAAWSSDGCTMVSTGENGTICNCTHLTDFVAKLELVVREAGAVFSTNPFEDQIRAYCLALCFMYDKCRKIC